MFRFAVAENYCTWIYRRKWL